MSSKKKTKKATTQIENLDADDKEIGVKSSSELSSDSKNETKKTEKMSSEASEKEEKEAVSEQKSTSKDNQKKQTDTSPLPEGQVRIELQTIVEHNGKHYRGVQVVPKDIVEELQTIDSKNLEERK